MNRPGRRSAGIVASLSFAMALSGCVPNDQGGYAAQCDLKSVDGFTLHLGRFVIDDAPVDVPDIPYFDVPHEIKWTPFHG